MGRFHNYSFGNILEIARQKPDATRIAGMYAWSQLGRKGQKGIRILVPIIGIRKKKDSEAEKDITKQNQPVLVGFRSAYPLLRPVGSLIVLLCSGRNRHRERRFREGKSEISIPHHLHLALPVHQNLCTFPATDLIGALLPSQR